MTFEERKIVTHYGDSLWSYRLFFIFANEKFKSKKSQQNRHHTKKNNFNEILNETAFHSLSPFSIAVIKRIHRTNKNQLSCECACNLTYLTKSSVSVCGECIYTYERTFEF